MEKKQKMKEITFPYGKKTLKYSFNENVSVLTSSIEEYKTDKNGEELVKEALLNPVGSKKLSELSVEKNKEHLYFPYIDYASWQISLGNI